MKKLFSYMLCLFLLMSLTGCITTRHKALSHYEESPVTAVGLYELPATEQSLWEDIFSNLTLVKQLPEEQIENFITDVQKWIYRDTIILLPVAQDPHMFFTSHFVVRVSYENGTWEMFDDSFCLYYDGKEYSRTLGGTDGEKWDSMLQQYFGLQ